MVKGENKTMCNLCHKFRVCTTENLNDFNLYSYGNKSKSVMVCKSCRKKYKD